MKKFVSMVMAAAMIFALAAPAFAAKATTSSAVKATLTAPKVNMTAAKVNVTANPYRIKITDPANTSGTTTAQIAMAPAAFVNKSDTKLNVYFLVTPTTANTVTFIDGLTATESTTTATTKVPSATMTVSFEKQAPYNSSSAPTTFDDQVINMGATKNAKNDFTVDATAANNDSFAVVTGSGTSAKITAIPVDLPTDATTGNAIWVKVDGFLNTDVDWTTWKDTASNKGAAIDFSIAVYCEPVANDPPSSGGSGTGNGTGTDTGSGTGTGTNP